MADTIMLSGIAANRDQGGEQSTSDQQAGGPSASRGTEGQKAQWFLARACTQVRARAGRSGSAFPSMEKS
jgi:hypothetical protein